MSNISFGAGILDASEDDTSVKCLDPGSADPALERHRTDDDGLPCAAARRSRFTPSVDA